MSFRRFKRLASNEPFAQEYNKLAAAVEFLLNPRPVSSSQIEVVERFGQPQVMVRRGAGFGSGGVTTLNNTTFNILGGLLFTGGAVTFQDPVELCYQVIWCISYPSDLGTGFDGVGGITDYDPSQIRQVYLFNSNTTVN